MSNQGKMPENLQELIKQAKSVQEASIPVDAVHITGILRKTSEQRSFALVTSDMSGLVEVLVEVNTDKVIKHEVLGETANKEKIVRIYLPANAPLKISYTVPAALASDASTMIPEPSFGMRPTPTAMARPTPTAMARPTPVMPIPGSFVRAVPGSNIIRSWIRY